MERRGGTGVSILDFTWYGVGPITTKYLADNGAHVVKVESNARLDGAAVGRPLEGRQAGDINTQPVLRRASTRPRRASLWT